MDCSADSETCDTPVKEKFAYTLVSIGKTESKQPSCRYARLVRASQSILGGKTKDELSDLYERDYVELHTNDERARKRMNAFVELYRRSTRRLYYKKLRK